MRKRVVYPYRAILIGGPMAGENHEMVEPQEDLAFPVKLDEVWYWRYYTLKEQRGAAEYLYEYAGTEEGLQPDWPDMEDRRG